MLPLVVAFPQSALTIPGPANDHSNFLGKSSLGLNRLVPALSPVWPASCASQALVHTRQAYPPKKMPCSLLPANPRGVGIRTFLHEEQGFDGSGDLVAGPLVGLSVEVDCRVACTMELLWDVDLAYLGGELHVDGKL